MILGLEGRSVYEEDFEAPFLEMSAEFFQVWERNPFSLFMCLFILIWVYISLWLPLKELKPLV